MSYQVSILLCYSWRVTKTISVERARKRPNFNKWLINYDRRVKEQNVKTSPTWQLSAILKTRFVLNKTLLQTIYSSNLSIKTSIQTEWIFFFFNCVCYFKIILFVFLVWALEQNVEWWKEKSKWHEIKSIAGKSPILLWHESVFSLCQSTCTKI